MWERWGRSANRLDQVRPRRPRLKWISEILRLAGNLPVAEFHDAYSVRRRTVIAEYEFGDPEVAVADDPLDGEALLARLHCSALLNLASAANALARLRIVKDRVLTIDLVLDQEIIRIGCGPMSFERSPYLAIFHIRSPARPLSTACAGPERLTSYLRSYSKRGMARNFSFVAPDNTNRSLLILNCEAGIATSWEPMPRKPPVPTIP